MKQYKSNNFAYKKESKWRFKHAIKLHTVSKDKNKHIKTFQEQQKKN